MCVVVTYRSVAVAVHGQGTLVVWVVVAQLKVAGLGRGGWRVEMMGDSTFTRPTPFSFPFPALPPLSYLFCPLP